MPWSAEEGTDETLEDKDPNASLNVGVFAWPVEDAIVEVLEDKDPKASSKVGALLLVCESFSEACLSGSGCVTAKAFEVFEGAFCSPVVWTEGKKALSKALTLVVAAKPFTDEGCTGGAVKGDSFAFAAAAKSKLSSKDESSLNWG